MMDYIKPRPEFFGMPFTADSFNDMPYTYLGSTGCRVSKVGLGTWKYGYPETGDGARLNKKEAFKIFDRAVELGVTFWDTANRYNASSGNSERVIGEWLKANPDQRRNIVLATKMFGLMDGKTPNHCRLGRINVLEATYACMERLRVDHIDLLYFHNYDPVTPVEESLQAVTDLMSRDLVRYFAVSNYDLDRLKPYEAAAKKGYPRACAVQNAFNILDGERGPAIAAPGVLDYCAKNGISHIAHGPLGQGMLTGRYLDPEKVGKGDRLFDEKAVDKKLTPENRTKLQGLAELAGEWDMEVSQLTLAYTLTIPGMGPVIPGASTVEQLESNAKVGSIELSDEQIKRVKKALG